MSDFPVHGPYHLDQMEVGMFDPITSAEGLRLVDEFLSTSQPPAKRTDLDLERHLLEPLSKADSIFVLRGHPEAKHETAWILGDFVELVMILRGPSMVIDVAMAQD